MRVSVTQKHIDTGWPSDPEHCPVALALRASGFPAATVGHDTVRLRGYCSEKSIELPADAVRWIVEFDDEPDDEPKLSEPFSFELKI